MHKSTGTLSFFTSFQIFNLSYYNYNSNNDLKNMHMMKSLSLNKDICINSNILKINNPCHRIKNPQLHSPTIGLFSLLAFHNFCHAI